MKSFVRLFLPLFCSMHTMAFSQKTVVSEQPSAIHFEDSLGWKEILAKAKKESKYIFLDCYTTWCGPCKRLDREVYIVDSVGTFFNDNFISVKMQMDKKKTDSKTIKARYEDAAYIEKTYEIDAYPTLIFFSPKGEIVNREAGYFNPSNLLNIARIALQPGRSYTDPVADLKQSIKLYRKKGATLGDIKQLIDKANALGKRSVADSLSKSYIALLRKQPPSNLYQKDLLLTISDSELDLNDPLLKLFYPNGSKVDAIVGTGFSKFVVDRYIRNTYFERTKFFVKEIPTARWDSMKNVIAKRFPGEWSSRAIAAAKAEWHMRNKDKVLFPEHVITLVENYGLESVLAYDYFLGFTSKFEEARKIKALIVNSICWQFVFGLRENTNLLDRGITCMKMVIQDGEGDSTAWWNTQTFDTYANMLYKRGRVKEAIEYEQKALDLLKAEPDSPKDMITSYEEVLKKMRSGTPTWPI